MISNLAARVHGAMHTLMRDRRPVDQYEVVVSRDVYFDTVREYHPLMYGLEVAGEVKVFGLPVRIEDNLPQQVVRLVHTLEA